MPMPVRRWPRPGAGLSQQWVGGIVGSEGVGVGALDDENHHRLMALVDGLHEAAQVLDAPDSGSIREQPDSITTRVTDLVST